MSEPITPQQDHDRRIGRMEGIAEQLDRRLDSIERAVAEQGHQLRQDLAEQGHQLRQDIRELRSSVRWLIGIQFGVVGLLVSILLKLN